MKVEEIRERLSVEMDEDFTRMIQELWSDTTAMSVHRQVAAATAMVLVAGNVVRLNAPPELRENMLESMVELLKLGVTKTPEEAP